jgi:hypothetical protein
MTTTRPVFLTLVLALAGLTALPSATMPVAARHWGCRFTGPPCQAAWQVAAVFVGQVVRIEPTRVTDPTLLDMGEGRRVTFRVTEAFRGVTEGAVAVLELPDGDGPPKAFAFEPSRAFVVYANRLPGGQLVTGSCYRTRSVEHGTEDLAYLRGPARVPSALGTVMGTARVREMKTPEPPFELWSRYPGRRVTIEADGAPDRLRFETVTDRDGRFSVRAPVGTYKVSVQVVEDGWKSNGTTAELLDGRGCVEAGLVVNKPAAQRSVRPRD